jgi:hypothetical protein
LQANGHSSETLALIQVQRQRPLKFSESQTRKKLYLAKEALCGFCSEPKFAHTVIKTHGIGNGKDEQIYYDSGND